MKQKVLKMKGIFQFTISQLIVALLSGGRWSSANSTSGLEARYVLATDLKNMLLYKFLD